MIVNSKILNRWYFQALIITLMAVLLMASREVMQVSENSIKSDSYALKNKSGLNAASQMLHRYFYFADLTIMSRDKNICNQQKLLNDWYLGNILLNENNFIVDRIYEETSVYSAILQRNNKDFQVLATSLINENGKRATDFFISEAGQAFKHLSEGKIYSTREKIDGKWFYANYEPIIVDNKVVGALFSAIEE